MDVFNNALYAESPLSRGRKNGRIVTASDGKRRYVWRVDADPSKCSSYQIEEIGGILHARVMPTPLNMNLTVNLPG